MATAGERFPFHPRFDARACRQRQGLLGALHCLAEGFPLHILPWTSIATYVLLVNSFSGTKHRLRHRHAAVAEEIDGRLNSHDFSTACQILPVLRGEKNSREDLRDVNKASARICPRHSNPQAFDARERQSRKDARSSVTQSEELSPVTWA